jgi:hypothetical protein
MPQLNVDSKELKLYLLKLERLSEYAVPVTVRNTLNRAAKEMKSGGLMQKQFEDNFTIRRKSFIKSHTGYKPESFSQLNINSMKADAGVIKGKSRAGDDLEKQEIGGSVKRRQVPYSDGSSSTARIGNSFSKKIQSKFYFRKYKNLKLGSHKIGDNAKIVKTNKSIKLYSKNKEPRTLYIFRVSATIKKDPFVKPSGLQAAKKLNYFFIQEAKKRLKI